MLSAAKRRACRGSRLSRASVLGPGAWLLAGGAAGLPAAWGGGDMSASDTEKWAMEAPTAALCCLSASSCSAT